jgi:hypothetical protein
MSNRKRERAFRDTAAARRPAGVSVDHYPAGAAPDRFHPGDFSLHRATATKGPGGATTTLGKLIQAGERTRYGNSDYARWTHSALIVSENGDICEALERGVTEDNISKYRGTDYLVVHVTASDAQRALACGFGRTRVGDRYGVLNFVGLAVQSLFGWNLSVHADGQFICSGLVARATEKYIDAYPRSPENMMPGDLAFFWGADSDEPLPALGGFGQALNLLVACVDLFRRRPGDPAPDPGHPSPSPSPSRSPSPSARPPADPGDRETTPVA